MTQDDGFANISQVDADKPWIRKAVGVHEIDHQLNNLKTVATFNAQAWVRLSETFKRRQDMSGAEMALVGARYCDFGNKELMQEWLAVFSFNRWEEMTPERILHDANIADGGLCDVANHDGRKLEELQLVLFHIENHVRGVA